MSSDKYLIIIASGSYITISKEMLSRRGREEDNNAGKWRLFFKAGNDTEGYVSGHDPTVWTEFGHF